MELCFGLQADPRLARIQAAQPALDKEEAVGRHREIAAAQIVSRKAPPGEPEAGEEAGSQKSSESGLEGDVEVKVEEEEEEEEEEVLAARRAAVRAKCGPPFLRLHNAPCPYT